MQYLLDKAGNLIKIADQDDLVYPSYEDAKSRGCEWISDWNILSFEEAHDLALSATNLQIGFPHRQYLAFDRGSSCSPRFGLVVAPTIGEEVSRGFNGDYYPAGKILKISKSFRRIETDTGVVFYRRRLSDVWKNGRTWSMVPGIHDELNPSF